jgi:AcrR family transcriptional regulator
MSQSILSAPPISRRERRKREVQDRIIEASIELFTEQDCEAVTVEQICERADVSRKTFYNYYLSKQYLIYALSESIVFDEAQRIADSAREHSEDTIERIRYLLDQMSIILRNFAALERTLMRHTMKDSVRDDDRAAERWHHMDKLITGLIEEGQARNDITTAFSAQFLGEIVAGTLNTITVSWVYDEQYPVGQRLIELGNFLAGALRKPS